MNESNEMTAKELVAFAALGLDGSGRLPSGWWVAFRRAITVLLHCHPT